MNELIDGASDKINGFADDLMYLEREEQKQKRTYRRYF